MPATVTVQVRLNKKALDKELHERDGAVGYVIAGFAGQVTKDIKDVFQQRAGGKWWPVVSSISTGTKGVHLTVTVKKSKAHKIIAKNAPMLVFLWEREGRMFVGPSVNHPGSSPPEKLILSGIDRASKRIQFTTKAPTVTSTD
jgi:hypothetical protein